ncbi:MAG TPA: signal peptidase I [Candidatus Sulfotelmatobacter sp.]
MSHDVPTLGDLAVELLPRQESSRETRRYLLAALLSAFVPGLGQLFIGQRRKAVILFVLLTVLLIGFWPLRLLRFYWGFDALYFAWICLYTYASCSASLAIHLPQPKRLSKWWLAATFPLALLSLSLLGALVTRASGFRSFTIPSTSMETTLRPGDRFVVDLGSRLPEHRKIIVFIRNNTFFVKRVIAVSGDSIQGRNAVISLNGSRQDEPYVEHTGKEPPDWLINFGPIVVPNGKCFVMGDNRDVSLDSRSPVFGLVDDASIIGTPLYLFGSNRLGRSIR